MDSCCKKGVIVCSVITIVAINAGLLLSEVCIFPHIITFAFNPFNVGIYRGSYVATVGHASDFNKTPSLIKLLTHVHINLYPSV